MDSGQLGPALRCGSFQGKRLIVNEDEPRINTNRPKDSWNSLYDKRHQKRQDDIGNPSTLEGESQKPSRQAVAAATPNRFRTELID